LTQRFEHLGRQLQEQRLLAPIFPQQTKVRRSGCYRDCLSRNPDSNDFMVYSPTIRTLPVFLPWVTERSSPHHIGHKMVTTFSGNKTSTGPQKPGGCAFISHPKNCHPKNQKTPDSLLSRCRLLHPIRNRRCQKLLLRNSLTSDEKFSEGLKVFRECIHAGIVRSRSPALDLERYDPLTALQDEIDLMSAVAPIIYFHHRSLRTIEQVRPHGGLDESSPVVTIFLGRRVAQPGLRGHQSRVQHLKLRTRPPLQYFLPRELWDPFQTESGNMVLGRSYSVKTGPRYKSCAGTSHGLRLETFESIGLGTLSLNNFESTIGSRLCPLKVFHSSRRAKLPGMDEDP